MVKEISPKRVRQGNNSPRVLVVLTVSLVGAFIVVGAAFLYYASAFSAQSRVSNAPPTVATSTK